MAILTGLFVMGGLAGAGGTALLTAEDEAVDLVAGEQIASVQPGAEIGPSGGLAVTIDVYNPDERSVSVEPLALGGWDVSPGPADSVDAAPRAWTAMSFEVIPDCEGNVARTLDVMADGVPSELELTGDVIGFRRGRWLPSQLLLERQRQQYCGDNGIVLEPVVETRSWDGDTYVLDVRLPGHGRSGLGDLTIAEATAGVPFEVEAEGLPATLPAEGSITLTTRWTFDCDLEADDLAEPLVPGGVIPYEAMYLTTPDDVQIHADLSALLSGPRLTACDR